MNRVRFIWQKIWVILKEHYNLFGCHPNIQIAELTVDFLKQLSLKFL